MTVTPPALQAVWNEPPEVFAQRLVIRDLYNQERTLSPLFLEQVKAIELLGTYRRFIGIKPRQVGLTTLIVLFLFAKTYRSPHPRQVGVVAHLDSAATRTRQMLDAAYYGLPKALQFGFHRNNVDETVFAHNKAGFRRMVAGGNHQGRSFTFNDLHLTEMAFWPRGRSGAASQGKTETAADADLYSSLLAAHHDPDGHVVVESTGDGPHGKFYELVTEVQKGIEDTAFLFIPWSLVARYRRDPGPGWERTPEEDALAKKYGLDDHQLAWRRWKMRSEVMSDIRFRREYPLTPLDPFLLEQAVWFDQDALMVMAHLLDVREGATRPGELHTCLPHEPGRKYFIGMDTAGGVGRDEAVIVVLRDDLEMAAMWASNMVPPDEQANVLADVIRKYPGSLALVERNKYGVQVLEDAQSMGLPLWRDADGDFWYGSGQRGGDSKREVMVWARRIVVDGMARVKDMRTVLQLQTIVEDWRGRIQARGDGHDDRVMAWVLALWCAKNYARDIKVIDPREEYARKTAEAVAKFEAMYLGGR
jgi:hypothetical protein